MKNYCEFKYGMVDMERLYAGLESMRCSVFLFQKQKYSCTWDEKQDTIFVKKRDSQDSLMLDIRISHDNENLNVSCQYSEMAYIIRYLTAISILAILFAILLGDGDVLYKIQGVLIILATYYLFALFVNKLSFLRHSEDLKKDLRKIIRSEPISSVYKWKWYVDIYDIHM
ncbi:MAG: hypothetical protein J6T67_11555 [Paludibacteraceae bacterium]|nr:hypothetical protein [Paludibacteraceae bacterium]